MQTFLPHDTYVASAKALDSQRLRKQLVECYQIALVLAGKSTAWSTHPATKMWIGYPEALLEYSNAIASEMLQRKYESATTALKIADTLAETFNKTLDGAQRHLFSARPWWLGHPDLHSSHRSALLFKAEQEWESARLVFGRVRVGDPHKKVASAAALKKWYTDQGWTEAPRYRYWWPTEHEHERTMPNEK